MTRKLVRKQLIMIVLGLTDITSTLLTLLLSVCITNEYTSHRINFDEEFFIVAFAVLLLWALLLNATHLARIPRTSALPVQLVDFVRFSIIGGFALLLLDRIIKLDNFPAFTLTLFVAINFFVLFSIRLVVCKLFKVFRANGHNIKNIIILANDSSLVMIDNILKNKEWGFKILHIISDSKLIRKHFGNRVKIYPKSANIKSLIYFDIVDEVICCDCVDSMEKLNELIRFCNDLGVTLRIQGIRDILVDMKGNKIVYFDKTPFVTFENNPMNRFQYIIKTTSEIIISFTILFIFSPILILVSLLIAITSKGPIIFKQERVGLRGRKFYIYKFRTMVFNAEELKESLLTLNESDGPTFKIKNDPRITVIGKFLRKTNLDELPQLYNILRGEMSLIGPRPPLSKEVETYERWQLKRLSVKPGLTCTWQIIQNRNNVKFDKWVKMDINYIENWSLKSDLELFLKTFKTVFFANGA